MEQFVQIFKALGDETRLKILIILCRRRICAKGLAKHLNISEAAVSQHIKVLKESGIIVGEKSGYYVNYSVQKTSFLSLESFIEEILKDEQIKGCNFGMDMPDVCKVECKKNKCCCKMRNLEEKI